MPRGTTPFVQRAGYRSNVQCQPGRRILAHSPNHLRSGQAARAPGLVGDLTQLNEFLGEKAELLGGDEARARRVGEPVQERDGTGERVAEPAKREARPRLPSGRSRTTRARTRGSWGRANYGGRVVGLLRALARRPGAPRGDRSQSGPCSFLPDLHASALARGAGGDNTVKPGASPCTDPGQGMGWAPRAAPVEP